MALELFDVYLGVFVASNDMHDLEVCFFAGVGYLNLGWGVLLKSVSDSTYPPGLFW